MPWNLFRTRFSRERDLDQEIESHLQMAIGDRLERGEQAGMADLSARREFGNVGLVKEVTRDIWAGARWNVCYRTSASVWAYFAAIRTSPPSP